MHIDMAALRALEREKDISFDVVVEAIEAALLSAYHKTPGAHAHARVELDKRSGDVTVWARERVEADLEDVPDGLEGETIRDQASTLSDEFNDTPEDFGRYAAADAPFPRLLCSAATRPQTGGGVAQSCRLLRLR